VLYAAMYAQKLLLAWTPQELPEGRRGNALVQKECAEHSAQSVTAPSG
jgi:hypothetical protein